VSSQYGFSIAFPVGWEFEEKSDTQISAFHPKDDDADTFCPNIQLFVVTRPSDPDFFEKNCAEMPTLMTEYREIDHGIKCAGSLNLKWIEYVAKEGDIFFRSINHVAVIGDHVATMAGVCREEQYDSVCQAFKTCAESIRLVNETDSNLQPVQINW
jgi:hypothetical protein